MNFVWLIPVFLSALLAAAHFLRAGNLLGVAVCLAAPVALAFRKAWVARVVQVALVLMALEWIRTLLGIIAEREAAHDSWKAAAIILISVAAFTAGSALVFLIPALKRRYHLGAYARSAQDEATDGR